MAKEDTKNLDGYEGEAPPPFVAGDDLDLYLAGRTNVMSTEEEIREEVDGVLLENEKRRIDLMNVMHEEMARVAPALELRREEPEPDFDPTELLNGQFDGLYPQEFLRGMHVIGTEHPLIRPPRGVQSRDVRRMRERIDAMHFAQGEGDTQ